MKLPKIPLWAVVLIYLSCWPAAVFADPQLVAQNGDSLTLHSSPCEDSTILAHIVASGGGHLLDRFKTATLLWHGETLKSCWVESEGWVYSIDEKGDRLQPLLRADFKDRTI